MIRKHKIVWSITLMLVVLTANFGFSITTLYCYCTQKQEVLLFASRTDSSHPGSECEKQEAEKTCHKASAPHVEKKSCCADPSKECSKKEGISDAHACHNGKNCMDSKVSLVKLDAKFFSERFLFQTLYVLPAICEVNVFFDVKHIPQNNGFHPITQNKAPPLPFGIDLVIRKGAFIC